MYCRHCGSQNPDSARFCIACGAAISSHANGTVHAAGDQHPLEKYEAVIGPDNRDYYLSHFSRMRDGGSRLSWHWPAFFLTSYWLLYRKMWIPALVYFIMPFVLLIPFGAVVAALAPTSGAAQSSVYLLYVGAYFFLPAMFANSLYFRHCRQKIESVAATSGSRERQLGELSAKGGTSGIAMLAISALFLIAMLGILAAIAIPAYQQYTIKAKVAQAESFGKLAAGSVAAYYYVNQKIPASLADTNFSAPYPSTVRELSMNPDDGTIMVKVSVGHPAVDGRSVMLVPTFDDDKKIEWTCLSRDIPEVHLPLACQASDDRI